MGSSSFHKNVAFNPNNGKVPYLSPLSNFTHKILNDLDQQFKSIPRFPYDVIRVPAGTVGLLPYLHVLVLSYLIEDLGPLFSYGFTSAGLLRHEK